MNDQYDSVNPHPVPDSIRVAQLHDRILGDLIVLHRTNLASDRQRWLAGIPPLTRLEAERRRREATHFQVAS